MVDLKLYVLGPPRLEQQGALVDLRLRKAMALLVYLVINHGDHSRDEMATMLWPENDQSSARANLRRTLYQVNKAVGIELISASPEILRINPGLQIWSDIGAFRESLLKAAPGRSDQHLRNSQRVVDLEDAASRYINDFLTGFTIPDSHEFDEWQFFETESVRANLVAVLRELVSIYEKKREFEQAIDHARRLLSQDQLNEEAHRTLMRLYAAAGQQAAALRQYQECERILENELGVSAQQETKDLYQYIRLNREEVVTTPSVQPSETQYVASEDVHIAYRVIGDGPVDIIFVCGFVTHMEQLFEEPSFTGFFQEMASFSRVVLFDRRGVGLSDRVGKLPTMEDTQDDLLAVMDAVGSKRAVLMGYVEGGPNCILFSATYPKLVTGMILCATNAKWSRTEDYPWALTDDQFDLWISRIMDHWGEPTNLDVYAPSRVHEPAFREWWAKSMRLASSPGGIKAVLEVMRSIDVRDILPVVRTPTLILQRKGDRVVRVEAGRYLADHIPGARYVELEGDDHWFFVGDTQPIIQEIRKFVQKLDKPELPEIMLATILYIEIMDEKIDIKRKITAEDKSAFKEKYLLREVTQFNGREVSQSNGLFIAIFDGPSRAIRCSRAILDAAQQQKISLRAGLHAGECELVLGKIVGVAVKIAQKILEAAEPDQILVSRTVKDLVVRSGFHFKAGEACSVEGVTGEWETFSLLD